MWKGALTKMVTTTILLSLPQTALPPAAAQALERFTLRMEVNPLANAFRDLGYRIVQKEIRQEQLQGMGNHAPPDSTWGRFIQLELRLDKRGKIVSVHTISGTELPGLADRLLGTEIHSSIGVDKVMGRFWLMAQAVSVKWDP